MANKGSTVSNIDLTFTNQDLPSAMDTKVIEGLHVDHVETCQNVHDSVAGNIKLITHSEVALVPTPTQ